VTPPLYPHDAFLLEDLSARHRARFEEGVQLFNDGLFWEAHEAWEDVWREKQDPQRQLIQGLIQAAAAYHLIRSRPRINGALRNIEKSLRKFEGMPDRCFGISIDGLCATLRSAHEEAERAGQEGLSEIAKEYDAKI